jgi:hypothetical protein
MQSNARSLFGHPFPTPAILKANNYFINTLSAEILLIVRYDLASRADFLRLRLTQIYPGRIRCQYFFYQQFL